MKKKTRFYSISDYLKEEFGTKTIKLSIDAGFTCPNRDGTIARGGCIFCSEDGSGELASNIEDQIKLLSNKWPHAKYLAYFQSHTNTYAPIDILRKKYYDALMHPNIDGIVIATRPDCLSDEVLDLLEEINDNHFMWVELGLQSIHPETAKFMNIGYELPVFDEAVEKLKKRNIKTVVHLILGLPGETEQDMFESVKYVTAKNIFGMKLHLLNVVKGSTLYEEMPDYVSFPSIESYVDLVVRLLEIIPDTVTMHRLTADAPRNILVSPEWSYKKLTILNSINRELSLRDTWQGRLANKS